MEVGEIIQNALETFDLEPPEIAPRFIDHLISNLTSAGYIGRANKACARPLDEWHEDHGFALWWTWKDGQWLGEPSYIGSPLCSDWPGYHTHWTPHPDFPAAPIGTAPSPAVGEDHG